MLSIKLLLLVICLYRFNPNIETLCFGIEAKQPKPTVSKQIETNRNNPIQLKILWKNTKISSKSNCFGCSSVYFGSRETPKHSVLVQKRNNQNKHFVWDSAETSFGPSFGCFESKLVSQDTLINPSSRERNDGHFFHAGPLITEICSVFLRFLPFCVFSIRGEESQTCVIQDRYRLGYTNLYKQHRSGGCPREV